MSNELEGTKEMKVRQVKVDIGIPLSRKVGEILVPLGTGGQGKFLYYNHMNYLSEDCTRVYRGLYKVMKELEIIKDRNQVLIVFTNYGRGANIGCYMDTHIIRDKTADKTIKRKKEQLSERHSTLMKRLFKVQQSLPSFGFSYALSEYHAIYNKPLRLPPCTSDIEEAEGLPVKCVHYLVGM